MARPLVSSVSSNLIAPVSRGLTRAQRFGPEFIANHLLTAWTADDPDGFTVYGEDAANYLTEVSNGARLVSDGSAFVGFETPAVMLQGLPYLVRVDVESKSGANLLRVDDTGGGNSHTVSVAGTYAWTFVPAGASRGVRIVRNAPGTALNAVIRRVSVRKYL